MRETERKPKIKVMWRDVKNRPRGNKRGVYREQTGYRNTGNTQEIQGINEEKGEQGINEKNTGNKRKYGVEGLNEDNVDGKWWKAYLIFQRRITTKSTAAREMREGVNECRRSRVEK